jgi:hypothetical protein
MNTPSTQPAEKGAGGGTDDGATDRSGQKDGT